MEILRSGKDGIHQNISGWGPYVPMHIEPTLQLTLRKEPTEFENKNPYTLQGYVQQQDGERQITFVVDGDEVGRVQLRLFEWGSDPGHRSGGTGIELQRSTWYSRLVRTPIENGPLSYAGSVFPDKTMLKPDSPLDAIFARALQEKIHGAEHFVGGAERPKIDREILTELRALRRIQQAFRQIEPLELKKTEEQDD